MTIVPETSLTVRVDRVEQDLRELRTDIRGLTGAVANLASTVAVLADRGYDARHIRDLLAERGAEAVIPSTRSRRIPIPHDTHAYRQRNLAERLWCRLKDWRRLATRYDKLSANFLSTALIAATITLLRQLSPEPRFCGLLGFPKPALRDSRLSFGRRPWAFWIVWC